MKKFARALTAHLGLIVTLAIAVWFEIYFYNTYTINGGSHLNLPLVSWENALRIFILIVIGYFIVFAGNYKQHFRTSICLLVPILVTGVLWLFLSDPLFSDRLGREDGVVENFSALFLFIGSLAALISSIKLAWYRQIAMSLLMLIASALLFIIGMEEISWMQRILEIESTGAFLESNMQQETNFHNFHTLLFENIYYFGAFVALVAIPFYKDRISAALSKTRFKNLSVILPSSWLIIPFSLMAGFLKGSPYYTSTFLVLAITLTIFILIHEIRKYTQQSKYLLATLGIYSLVIVIVSSLIYVLADYSQPPTRPNFPTEYRELIIAIGLFAYAVDTNYKITAERKRLSKPKKAKKPTNT